MNFRRILQRPIFLVTYKIIRYFKLTYGRSVDLEHKKNRNRPWILTVNGHQGFLEERET